MYNVVQCSHCGCCCAQLLRDLPGFAQNVREPPFGYPYSVKARALLHAHFDRRKLPSKTLDPGADLQLILALQRSLVVLSLESWRQGTCHPSGVCGWWKNRFINSSVRTKIDTFLRSMLVGEERMQFYDCICPHGFLSHHLSWPRRQRAKPGSCGQWPLDCYAIVL